MQTLTPRQTDQVHGARAVDNALTRILLDLMTGSPATIPSSPRDLIDF